MRKSIIKTGATEVETVVDFATAEVKDVKVKHHKYVASKESFLMIYSSMLGIFMEMSQAEIRIFGYCLRYANGIHFDISKKIRLDISKITGLNERTVLNTIPSLIDKHLIYRHDTGLFQINPRYAFQGSSKERDEQLTLIVEVGCIDC